MLFDRPKRCQNPAIGINGEIISDLTSHIKALWALFMYYVQM